MIPLVPALLMALSLALAHFVLIREPLGWLSPIRRIVTRLSFKLVMAVVTMITLLINVLLLPFLGINTVISIVIGFLGTAIYVELALFWIGNRLEREAHRPGLDLWEWAVPVTALGALIVTTFGLVTIAALASALIWWLPIPSIEDITSFLLPPSQGSP